MERLVVLTLKESSTPPPFSEYRMGLESDPGQEVGRKEAANGTPGCLIPARARPSEGGERVHGALLPGRR